MGDDASMECISDAGNIRAYSSWVTARPNLGSTREGVVSVQLLTNIITVSCSNNVIDKNFTLIYFNTLMTRLIYDEHLRFLIIYFAGFWFVQIDDDSFD